MINPTGKKTLHLMTSSTWPNLPIWPSNWKTGDEGYYSEIYGGWSILYRETSGWLCSLECLPPNQHNG